MEVNNLIKKHFEGFSRIKVAKTYKNFLKENKEVDSYLNDIVNEYPEYESTLYVLQSIIFNDVLKKCKECGKILKYSYGKYHDFCSYKCRNSNKEYNEKVKKSFKHTYNESITKKKIQNNILKYNVPHPNILKSIDTINSWKNFIVPNFSISNFIGRKFKYEWKCVRCGNVFNSSIHSTHHLSHLGSNFDRIPRCLKCYPYISGFSKKEKELVEFCKQYFPNLKENDRQLINPLELDIVIDDIKLAIEFNGLFYHDINHVFPGYHLNKVLKCNSIGYRLIHIWENEWNLNTQEKLKLIFENKEVIDYSQKLDRSWYNNLSGNFEEFSPEIIKINNFYIENCGYLKLLGN